MHCRAGIALPQGPAGHPPATRRTIKRTIKLALAPPNLTAAYRTSAQISARIQKKQTSNQTAAVQGAAAVRAFPQTARHYSSSSCSRVSTL